MSYIITAFQVELIKMRRSLAFLVAVAAPSVIAIFQIGMYLDYMDFYLGESLHNPWSTFNQTMLTYWTLMMLPLFITLEMALLAQMEHKHNNWKLLYSQPMPRWAIYLAKYLVGWLLVIISSLLLIGLMFATGYFLYMIYPAYGFNAPFPLLDVLKNIMIVSASAALLITIQTWISLRWNSFVVPLGVGIAGTIAGIFVFGSDLMYWYPWTIPGALAMEINLPNISSMILGLSGVLLMIPVCWNITRLEFD